MAAAADAGSASVELVIGWCIFGLLLLVGEALGVFPRLRLVGEREGPAGSWPLRAWVTLHAPPLAWTGGLRGAGMGRRWGRREEALISGCFCSLSTADV